MLFGLEDYVWWVGASNQFEYYINMWIVDTGGLHKGRVDQKDVESSVTHRDDDHSHDHDYDTKSDILLDTTAVTPTVIPDAKGFEELWFCTVVSELDSSWCRI